MKKPAWGVGVLAALVILTWVVLDIASGVKLRRAITAWQEAGLPMSGAEVLPPPVPPEENAGVIINGALPSRESLRHDQDSREIQKRAIELANEILPQLVEGTVSRDLLEELETNLQDPTLVYRLQIARQAIEFERFDAYIDYGQGWDTTIPHVGFMRHLARLLQAEAVANAALGKWPEAYQGLTASVRLGELLIEEPFFISQLSRWAIHKMAMTKLEVFLQAHTPGVEELERVTDFVAKVGHRDLLDLHLIGAAITAQWVYGLLEEGEFTVSRFDKQLDWGESHWSDKQIFRPLHKADYAALLNVYREMVDALRPEMDSMEGYQLLNEWGKTLDSKLPWYALATKEMLGHSGWPPQVSTIHLSEAQHLGHLALAQVAFAAHAYHSSSNEWPKTLADLVPVYMPEIPRDPFNREPLRYVRDDERIAIYSIGPNLNDDGGHVVKRVYADQPGDIVWVLEETGSD